MAASLEIEIPKSGGFIFDLDGVIMNSEEAHFMAWDDMLSRNNRNISLQEFRRKYFGRRNEDVITELLGTGLSEAEISRFSEEKEEKFREYLEEKVSPIAGVVEFIGKANSLGVAVGIGSSAPRKNIEATLAKFELETCVGGIVCSEEVVRGKPDPEVFVKAAGKIDRNIAESIVFEDAPSGVQAGVSAGALVVGVATTQPAEVLMHAGAARIIPDFSRVGISLSETSERRARLR